MKSRQPSRFSPKRQARPTRKLKLEVFACLEDRTVPTVDLGTAGMIKDEILVQFSMDTNVQQRALDRYNLNVQLKDEILGAQRLNMGDGAMELIKLPAGISSEKALAWYKSQPGVVFAEPNYHVTATAVSNDPYYTSGQLWGMEGSDSPTAVGPAGTTNTYGINAEAAWNDGQTGSKSIFVGIVDTGIQITHPDIADNIWTNPYDPVDGIDNDGNGFVDDIHGWDFSNNDNTVFDSATYDDHGTHVAGTIGGKGGNGAGVAGVNWNVTMISAKFLGPTGGTTADAVRAIDYITDLKVRHSMDVVATNNSWGGGGYSAALHSAIIRAAKADILTVIAAGNSTTNNDVTASYPSNTSTLVATTTDTAASYEGVIAVASLDSTERATPQPPLIEPTTSVTGTRTWSRNTSLKCEWPVISWSGRTVMPGDAKSTIMAVIPLCFGAAGSVRASRIARSQYCAYDVHTFWPVTTKWSPSVMARVPTLARSLPASGSLKS